MADQNIVTNITATANFSGLTTQLQSVTSQLLKLQATTIGLNKNLTSQVGVMNRQFDETMRSTGQFSRHFVTLTSDVSKFGQNLDSGRMKLSQYFNTYQGHTKKTSSLVKELAKQQVMLENAIVQPIGKNAQGLMQYNVMVQSGLDATKNKSALLRQELSIMNKVMNDGAGQLINWGKNTQWAGRQLTVGLTVPLAAFGMAAAKAFRQADEELVRLTKVYGGLTATSSADLLQVRKDVSALSRELAGSLGANFTETIALAADIAATGKEGEALLESTRQTTRLAILGEVDRQDAMKATLSIQTAFGQSTQELAESIDFLNAVENQTSTTLDDLVTAIPKAGPVVKALGGDVQDLALYLTAMREGGINASEGANALKSALASVINPTKVAKEMFLGLGIDLSGIVDKNAGNLTGTIMALKDSLDSLEPLQRARAIEQLFGKFQFARINALFENLGKEGSQTLQVLDLMKASTKELASISDRELTALTESASGKYRRALEAVKADLAVVGEQFLKVGAFVLNAIDGIIKFIGNLPGPIKAVLGFIGSLTAIAGPIIMLTGVLANFFGYIIKGVLALKNIGKGGTGFKLLTPELMAADAAAKSVEASFYSDTKAATTFSNAVLTLASSFEKLKASAMSSTIATSNSMSTVAGNTVMPGGGRIVDKNNPLVGKAYSRDMSHMIPTGSKTADQRSAETIFSTVPGPKPVNQKISNAAQLYMNDDLPRIPGLTSANGVSTGVVAAEAAKWHSMTSAIAMQSKTELAMLKTEIAATGTVTASLSDSYQALLPQMTKITSLAADETALIVKQLQAGKLTVEAARTKIFALNAQVEAMMVQTAQGVATAQARSLNLGMVPLTNQPVVSAAGKSNMKELFHKGSTSSLVDSIARGLGVRTSGAGYSMQTTMPRRYNDGGKIEAFGPGKTQVTGPASITYDDRMGTVPIGGYVLNQSASLDPRNAPLVAAASSTYSSGGSGNIDALLTPKETVFGPGIKDNPELFRAVDAANNGVPLSKNSEGGKISLSRSSYGSRPTPQAILAMFSGAWLKAQSRRSVMMRGNKLPRHYFSTATGADVNARRNDLLTSHNSGWKISRPDGTKYTAKELESLPKDEVNAVWKGVDRSHFAPAVATNTSGQYVSPGILGPQPRYGAGGNLSLNAGGDPSTILRSLLNSPIHPFSTMKSASGILGYPQDASNRYFNDAWSEVQAGLRKRTTPFGNKTDTFEEFVGGILAGNLRKLKIPNTSTNFFDEMSKVGTLRGSGIRGSGATVVANNSGISFFNQGGMISEMDLSEVVANKGGKVVTLPSQNGMYNVGGMIKSGTRNYGFKLPQEKLDKLTAKWPPVKQFYQPGFQYMLGNQDPLHGPLQIGMGNNLKRYSGYKPNDYETRQQVVFRDERFSRLNMMPAFLTGTAEKRGKYATAQYMDGNLDIMSQMERLGNHPLGPISAMRSVQKKFTGKLFRGLKLDKTFKGLPQDLIEAIRLARATGDASALIGREFIMRRSSWSKDPGIASFFAPGSKVTPESLLIEASVRNRNILPAGDMFPDKKFMAPHGQDWSGGKPGMQYRSEQEAMFGGKFRVLGFKDGKLSVETVVDAAREMGGPVNSGRPYLVGENGPEVFVPKNAGGIIPNYALGGMIRAGKNFYGARDRKRSGNPAKAAQQDQALDARRSEFESAPYDTPERKPGSMYGVKYSSGGTNAYGVEGPNPYAPGLKLPLQNLNNSITTSMDSITKGLKASSAKLITSTTIAASDISKSINSLGTKIKDSGYRTAGMIKNRKNTIVDEKTIAANAPGALFNPAYIDRNGKEVPASRADKAIRRSFMANARYSTSAMVHPVQYMKAKGIVNPELGQGAMGSMVGMMGGSAAGSAIGGAIGGQQGAMVGGMAGMMGGQTVVSKLGESISKRAAASAATAGLASAGFGTTAAAAAGLVAPLLAVTAAGVAGYAMWKNYKKGQDLNISTFGLNAEAAKKAGLTYTDYGQKIKDVIQDARDLESANKLVYESMKDGGTPFKMTIAEYKKLKVEVKETFGEQIKALDRQPSTKVPDAVRRIKEQLIAAGMSADEATKKVYTMLRLSNKKDQAITATMGNAQFRGITDAQTAAVSSVTSFGQSTRNEGKKERAAALNTALMATETGINDLIEKRERLVAKDLTGKTQSLTYAEAEKIMLDKLNSSKEAGTAITKETVDELAKANPQVRKIISASDTVVSVWQKIRLQAQGFSGDLSKLNAEQVGAVSAAFSAIGSSVEATNRTGMLKSQYDNLEKLKTQISDYTKALKGQTVAQQISDRDRINALNKQIEANNKLAEARKRALSAAQQDADLGRKIEKTRLEMQNAMATGDTAKAQSLRIDLESFTSQQQTEAQMKAIDTATEKANAKPKAAIDAMGKKQQGLADSAALAGESLDKIKDKYDKQQAAIDKVNKAMTALYGNAEAAGVTIKEYIKTVKGGREAAGLVSATEDATGNKMPRYTTKTTTEITAKGPVTTTQKVPVSPEANTLSIMANSKTKLGVDEALAQSIKGGATLKDIVNAVKGVDEKGPLRKNIKVTGDYSKSMEEKTYDGKKVNVLSGDARDAIAKRENLRLGETFDYQGKTYGKSKTNSDIVYIGPAKKAATGVVGGSGMFLVGERGPEMVHLKNKANIMPNDVMNTLAAASPRYNFNRDSFSVKGQSSSGGSYVVNQNIYASEGMDVEALSNMIVKKAEVVIGQKAKVNVKMVGQEKSI